MVLFLMIAMSLTPQAMQARSNPSPAAPEPRACETPRPRILIKDNFSILNSPTDGCGEQSEEFIVNEWARGCLPKRDLASRLQPFGKLEASMFSAHGESSTFGIPPFQVFRDWVTPLATPSSQSSFPG